MNKSVSFRHGNASRSTNKKAMLHVLFVLCLGTHSSAYSQTHTPFFDLLKPDGNCVPTAVTFKNAPCFADSMRSNILYDSHTNTAISLHGIQRLVMLIAMNVITEICAP
jgi:hypothetical protein